MLCHRVTPEIKARCYPIVTPEEFLMKRKLTAAAVKKMRPPATGRLEIFDSLTPGLVLRVTNKGRKLA